jgi:hypothetical protein
VERIEGKIRCRCVINGRVANIPGARPTEHQRFSTVAPNIMWAGNLKGDSLGGEFRKKRIIYLGSFLGPRGH